MKMIFILTMLLSATAFSAGRLTNSDFKTLAEIQAVSGTAANLLNDTKIYVTANGLNKQLSAAITAGDLAGAGSVLNVSTTAVSVTMPANTNVMIASAPVTVTLLPAASYTSVITVKRNFTTSGVVLIQTSLGQLIEAVSASTSLVNYNESISLIPTSTGFVYGDKDGATRQFSFSIGGATKTSQCTTANCPMYNNTGAVSGVARTATGTYRTDLVPQTCRKAPACAGNMFDNVNYSSMIPLATSSATVYGFGTGTGAANDSWGDVVCSCERW